VNISIVVNTSETYILIYVKRIIILFICLFLTLKGDQGERI